MLSPIRRAASCGRRRERKDARKTARDAPARTAEEFITTLAPDVRPAVERLREWLRSQEDVAEKVVEQKVGKPIRKVKGAVAEAKDKVEEAVGKAAEVVEDKLT